MGRSVLSRENADLAPRDADAVAVETPARAERVKRPT